MDKKSAIETIEKTFNAKFNEENFRLFINNLLNDIEPRNNHYAGARLWEAYRDHVHAYKRIGKYVDPNDEALDILIVEVKDTTKLERTRTALRNFVIKHLKTFEKDYALVAFYSKQDGGREWRFSFVKLEHQAYMDEEKNRVKIKKEFTPAKRYSFLVGEDEHIHTAKEQLLPLFQNIYDNPTIEEIEDAFSIEKVTDEFFEQYKALYVKLYEHFEKDATLQSELAAHGIDTARFTKKLLGQIVFLYFLQKKGWLGVDKDDNWGKGDKKFIQKLFTQAENEDKNFFKDFLQYLFYDALANEHADEGIASYYARFKRKIPFLNGGLFEADYAWESANITIPADLFRNDEKTKAGDKGTGVLDVFDRYNFTIKEDEPLEKEVAVDPEMLGKVFENMLEIKERKSKGAFYTPREIVHYMCQESLIHYLDNSLNDYTNTYQELDSNQPQFFGNEIKTGQGTLMIEHKSILVPKEDIESFIRNADFALQNDETVVRKGKETARYRFQLPESIRNNADSIDKALTNIKILDPAIGSGAFPVGLLHELVNAQLVLKVHLSKKYLKEKNEIIGFAESGDDINGNRYVYRIKRHSIQESIYGVDIDASAIDIARLRLWLSLVVDEDDFDPIETLPNLDYKIVQGNSLIGMPENSFRDLEIEKELEELKNLFYDETNEKEKKELRIKINTKIRQLLDSAEQFVNYKINFDFNLFFSEVWHKKDGFDIVIGNPPYDVYQETKLGELNIIKKIPLYEKAKGRKLNAFELFLALAPTLLKKKGVLNFIFQNSFLADTSSSKLRYYFFKEQTIKKIDSFPERDNINTRVFKTAKISVCILLSENQKINKVEKNNFILNIWKERWMKNKTKVILNTEEIISLDPIYYSIPSLSSDEYKILEKLSHYNKLSSIGHCYEGEINLTTHKKYLSTILTDNYLPMIKGASVQKWFITNKMSQGINEFVNLKYTIDHHRSKKSKHHQQKRLVLQGITGVDEKFRLKIAMINKNIFCGNSANYILFNDQSVSESFVSILNSTLLNWFFKKYSTNSNVNGYEIDNLPIIIDKYQYLDILYH